MADIDDYARMQKTYYEDPSLDPKRQVVGNYDWHEAFPYELCLLHTDSDKDLPLFEETKNRVALDFGCGPGRMVRRMSNLFERVDGVDISARLIDMCRSEFPQSNFYVTDGKGLGDVPENTYDFIYSTICMQHIASFTVRDAIYRQMHRSLKDGGCINIQMAYRENFPGGGHARWNEDRFDAGATNSGCDVVITQEDIYGILDYLTDCYSKAYVWKYRVDDKYANLNGQIHPTDYWPTHWIFINAWK